MDPVCWCAVTWRMSAGQIHEAVPIRNSERGWGRGLRAHEGQRFGLRQPSDGPREVDAAVAVDRPNGDRSARIAAMPEQIALGLAARDDRGRATPVEEGVGCRLTVARVQVPGQRGLGDAAGIVMKADQRIELVRGNRIRSTYASNRTFISKSRACPSITPPLVCARARWSAGGCPSSGHVKQHVRRRDESRRCRR